MNGIYDEPELYQLACAYRDVPAEVSALLTWCDKHYENGGVQSVLELAAGPAEHAREFARRGLAVTALDRSAAMCAYAAGRARAAGLGLEVVEADMRDFAIPRRFDLAITMLNSACHLFTLDDLLAHLTAVAAHLVPGGLYVMEFAHPADYLAAVPRTSSEWSIEQDGIRAQVRWGGSEDQIDPVSQITREHMSITARMPDGTVRTVSDVVPNRFWTATELTAAIRLAAAAATATAATAAGGAGTPGAGGGFTVAATYGDFDDTTALDDPAAWRMILILRRD